MSKIRYFICGHISCHATTPIDLNVIKKPLSNSVVCSKCGRQWIATLTSSCCAVNIKYVSVESGNKKPITFLQAYRKE